MWGNLLRNAAAIATESAQNIVGNLDEIASKASNLLETLDQGIGNEDEENTSSVDGDSPQDSKVPSKDYQDEQQLNKSEFTQDDHTKELNDSMLNTSLELNTEEHEISVPPKSDTWDTVSDIASIQLQVGDIKEKHEKLLKNASALDSENQKIYLELSAQHRATVEKYKTKREECKRLEFELQVKTNHLILSESKLMEAEKHVQQLMDQNTHLSSFVAETETQRDDLLQQLQIQREDSRRQMDALRSEKKAILNCLTTLEESLPEEGVVGISEDDLLDKVDTSDSELRDLMERFVYKFMASALYSEKSDEKYKSAIETITAMEKEIAHLNNELMDSRPKVETLTKENEILRNELESARRESDRVQANETNTENSGKMQELKDEILRLEEEIETLQTEKKMIQEAFDSKVEDYEVTIAELRQAVTEGDEKVQEVEESMSQLREDMESKIYALENNKREEIQFQSIHSEAKIQSLSEEIEIMKAELKMMETENHALKAQLDAFHHERTAFETDLEHRNASIVKLEEELTLLKEAQCKLREEILNLDKEKSQIQHQLQESLDTIATTIDNAEKLEEQRSSLEEENRKLMDTLSQLQTAGEISDSSEIHVNEELQAIKNLLEEKSQRLEELEWEHGDAQSRIAEFEQLVARLNSEVTAAQSREAQLEEELKNARLAVETKLSVDNNNKERDTKLKEKSQDIALLEKSLTEANETIELLQQQLLLLENQRDNAQHEETESSEIEKEKDHEETEKIQTLNNKIEELMKEKEAIETTMERLTAEITVTNESQEYALAQAAELRQEVQLISEKVSASEAIVAEQKSRIEQLEGEIVRLTPACDKTSASEPNETAAGTDLTDKLTHLEEEKDLVEKMVSSLQEEVSRYVTLLQEKQDEIEKLQTAVSLLEDADEELLTLKSLLESAQELNKENELVIANLREELSQEKETKQASIDKWEERLQAQTDLASSLKDEFQQLNDRYLEEVEKSKNLTNALDLERSEKAEVESQLISANKRLLESETASEKEDAQAMQQIVELTSIAEKRNKEILTLQEQLEDALSEKNEMDRQFRELHDKLSVVTEEKIVSEEKVFFLQQEMINVQSTLAATDEMISDLETVRDDATRWEQDHKATLQVLEGKEQEIKDLEARLELSSAEKEQENAIQLHAKAVEIAALSEQIQSLQDSLRAQEATWSTTVQTKADECLSLTAQVQTLQESLSLLRQEAETRLQQQHLLEAAYAEAQMKTVALETSRDTWKVKAQDLQETLSHLQDSFDAVTKEEMPGLHTANATLSEEVTFLQQEQRRWVTENDHLRSRLSQVEQSLQTTQKDLQQTQQKLQQAHSWEPRATQAEEQLKKLDNKKKKDLEMLKKQNEKINLLQQELHTLRDHQALQVSAPAPAVAATTKTYSEAEWQAQEAAVSEKMKSMQEDYMALHRELTSKQDHCVSLERQLQQLEEDFVKSQGELEACKQEITFLEQDVTEWKAKAEATNNNNGQVLPDAKDTEEEQEKAQQQLQALRFLQTQVQELQMTIQTMREQHAQALQTVQDKAQTQIADLHKQASHWKRENARLMEDVHRLEQKVETHKHGHVSTGNNTVSEKHQDIEMDMEAGNYVSTSDSNSSSTSRVKASAAAGGHNNYQNQLNRMIDEGKTLMDVQHGTTLLVLADDKKDLAGLHPWLIQLWAMLRQKCASYPWLLAILGERPPRLSTSAQLLLLYVLFLQIYVLYLRSFGCHRDSSAVDAMASAASATSGV